MLVLKNGSCEHTTNDIPTFSPQIRNLEIGPTERLLPVFGTKNRILKNGSSERTFRLLWAYRFGLSNAVLTCYITYNNMLYGTEGLTLCNATKVKPAFSPLRQICSLSQLAPPHASDDKSTQDPFEWPGKNLGFQIVHSNTYASISSFRAKNNEVSPTCHHLQMVAPTQKRPIFTCKQARTTFSFQILCRLFNCASCLPDIIPITLLTKIQLSLHGQIHIDFCHYPKMTFSD